jgi:hypothetical protein
MRNAAFPKRTQEEPMTDRQPNKPDGEEDGKPRPVDQHRAVRNQGEATPDDYPPGSDGKPD